jgi:NurA domain
LEIPLWIQEQGLLDEVIDLIRAEVIVGNGYPYVLESADAAAVITSRDRDAFYAIFQKFAEEQSLQLKISQKAVSKNRRR